MRGAGEDYEYGGSTPFGLPSPDRGHNARFREARLPVIPELGGQNGVKPPYSIRRSSHSAVAPFRFDRVPTAYYATARMGYKIPHLRWSFAACFSRNDDQLHRPPGTRHSRAGLTREIGWSELDYVDIIGFRFPRLHDAVSGRIIDGLAQNLLAIAINVVVARC